MHEGVGFQLNFYTGPILKELERNGAPLDYVEMLCDTVAGAMDGPHVIDPKHRGWFEELRDRRSIIAHSNYGEEYGFRDLADTPMMRRHVPIVREMKSPWVADHMFYGTEQTSFLWSTPVQFSFREVDRIADRAARLQDALGVPLAHENAFIYAVFPGSDIEEAEFLAELTRRASTWLCLDLHNVYANSVNFDGYDPWRYLRTIPLDRVIQIQVAGGQWLDGWYHDLHNSPVPEPVWELVEHVMKQAKNCRSISLEMQGLLHTAQMKQPDETWPLIAKADLERAKKIWEAHRGRTL